MATTPELLSNVRPSPAAATLTSGAVVSPRPGETLPADFQAALAQSPMAASAFAVLGNSCRREYLDWITEAKKGETRARRIAVTLLRLAEAGRGKEECGAAALRNGETA